MQFEFELSNLTSNKIVMTSELMEYLYNDSVKAKSLFGNIFRVPFLIPSDYYRYRKYSFHSNFSEKSVRRDGFSLLAIFFLNRKKNHQ